MIINDLEDLSLAIEYLKGLNKEVLGKTVIIKESSLSSIFSSSPYINDLELDICQITYNIMKDHPFIDGNKRTALAFLISAANNYDINILKSDDELFDLMINLLTDKITIENFKTNIFG